MEIKLDEISRIIKEQIRGMGEVELPEETGQIVSVGDGIASVYGLANAMAGELVEFPHGIQGIALNLEEDIVGIAVMGDDSLIKENDVVRRTGKIASVPVGEELAGRVVDALGNPIDNAGPIKSDKTRMIEVKAPGVVARRPVHQPLLTGIKAVDTMIPIGKGQRELIIGDRQTGKTAIAIDAIINQRGKGVHCVYVAIGQKSSTVAMLVDRLRANGAMEYTTVVVAGASDPAPLQYLAPYTGATLGEYYRDSKRDALVVYDDLSKHAVAYREVSLLLRRPPGREAFPGDIFYLHSRLLERAAKLSDENGGGSLTALPIVETQDGDISAYIPTNVISITDGQIYLESDLFRSGQRPAINVGLSVSRVGGAAQPPAVKKIAGSLRLELARFREMAAFAQFGAEMDDATRRQIVRGERLTEILKQPQFKPMDVASEVLEVFAGTSGAMDDIPLTDVRKFISGLSVFMEQNKKPTLDRIAKSGDLDEETKLELKLAIEEFKNQFAVTNSSAD